jgi:hypothetical protein
MMSPYMKQSIRTLRSAGFALLLLSQTGFAQPFDPAIHDHYCGESGRYSSLEAARDGMLAFVEKNAKCAATPYEDWIQAGKGGGIAPGGPCEGAAFIHKFTLCDESPPGARQFVFFRMTRAAPSKPVPGGTTPWLLRPGWCKFAMRESGICGWLR